jgi:hypothetical protein
VVTGPDLSKALLPSTVLDTLTVTQRQQLNRLHSLWHVAKEHYAELDRDNIPYRKGKWSQQEEELLNGSLLEFKHKHPEVRRKHKGCNTAWHGLFCLQCMSLKPCALL